MGIKIGRTETGKLYHIVNVMTGGENFGLCGCYLPKDKQVDTDKIFELEEENKICEKCMHSRFYK